MVKAFDKWLLPYLLRRRPRLAGPMDVMFMVGDHYEPHSPHGRTPPEIGRERVRRWSDEFPPLAERFTDADGHHPKQTFFFPPEEYRREYLDALAELTARGLGEVEIHVHHDDDTPENLTELLTQYRERLANDHGLLTRAENGTPRYAFIHGNWALCNSLPGGTRCGVNEELTVLKRTGCYADMTMPAVPSPAQARTINAIYYAKDTPGKSRGHDTGQRVIAGSPFESSDHLLLIQGPLALNWRWRKFGILPRVEHADLCGTNPPTPLRADLWVRQHIHVTGQPNWVFVKLHTHGCKEGNMQALLGEAMASLHKYLAERYNTGTHHRLHYVTAREMVNIVHAAEAGETGNAGNYRNYRYPPPPAAEGGAQPLEPGRKRPS